MVLLEHGTFLCTPRLPRGHRAVDKVVSPMPAPLMLESAVVKKSRITAVGASEHQIDGGVRADSGSRAPPTGRHGFTASGKARLSSDSRLLAVPLTVIHLPLQYFCTEQRVLRPFETRFSRAVAYVPSRQTHGRVPCRTIPTGDHKNGLDPPAGTSASRAEIAYLWRS